MRSLLSTALQAATANQPEPRYNLGALLSLLSLRECSAVATALGGTKSLNRSWQWHLRKRRRRRRIAFQIFGLQTYLFAVPSLLTICITSVLDWDSNKVYDLLALKNTSLGTSTQRCQRSLDLTETQFPLSEDSGYLGSLVMGKSPCLLDLKEEGKKALFGACDPFM